MDPASPIGCEALSPASNDSAAQSRHKKSLETLKELEYFLDQRSLITWRSLPASHRGSGGFPCCATHC